MCCLDLWCGLVGSGGVIGVRGVIEHVGERSWGVFGDPHGARGWRGYCDRGCRLLGAWILLFGSFGGLFYSGVRCGFLFPPYVVDSVCCLLP